MLKVHKGYTYVDFINLSLNFNLQFLVPDA